MKKIPILHATREGLTEKVALNLIEKKGAFGC
jgi:hypothetical protein